MSYLVLARKWRPRDFDSLVGQDHVVRALTHALTTQRLHHAWLFTGTRGVGKTTLSRILAKSLNCETGITARPCGQCSACTQIDAGRFVDYVELDAASNRGVDEMTQLLEQAIYAPTAARFKVYMIDEVHMLSGHAFNAMLKTLEEPPPHVKFILATTDPQKIPPTVLSRCLQFNLKQMAPDSIASHLAWVLEQENVRFEAPALRLIGQSASGSMRDALSLTDQAIAFSSGDLTLESVRSMLGSVDQTLLVQLLQSLYQCDARQVLEVARRLAERGLSLRAALSDLAILLSSVAITQRIGTCELEDETVREAVQHLASEMPADLVQLFYTVTVHSRQELAQAPDEFAGFVMICLRMLGFVDSMVDPQKKSAPLNPDPSTTTGPTSQSASPAQAVTLTDQVDRAVAVAPESGRASGIPAQVTASAQTSTDTGLEGLQTPGPDRSGVRTTTSQTSESSLRSDVQVANEEHSTPSGSHGPGRDLAAATDHDAYPQARQQGEDCNEDEGNSGEGNPGVDDDQESLLPWEDDLPALPVNVRQVNEDAVAHDLAEPSLLSDTDEPAGRGFSAALATQHRGSGGSADSLDDGGPKLHPDDELRGLDSELSDAPVDLAPLAGPEPVTLKSMLDDWSALATTLPVSGMARQLAMQSVCVGADEQCVTLRVETGAIARGSHVQRLSDAIQKKLGRPVRLEVTVGEFGAAKTAQQVADLEAQRRLQEARAKLDADPFVQTLVQEMGAQIVPGSVRPAGSGASV